ncbi:hypothetical protein V3C99_016744 [Haemonchus contortus]
MQNSAVGVIVPGGSTEFTMRVIFFVLCVLVVVAYSQRICEDYKDKTMGDKFCVAMKPFCNSEKETAVRFVTAFCPKTCGIC